MSEEEQLLAEFITKKVCSKASGRNESECNQNYPHDVYFIGNLRPAPTDANTPRDFTEPPHLKDLLNKLAPVAFGAEFRLLPKSNAIEINIKLQWSCYYRIFPTIDQQRKHQFQQSDEDLQQLNVNPAPTNDRKETITVNLADENEEEEKEASPEVELSTKDRIRTRSHKDSLFIRFKKILCQACGTIFLNRNNTNDWDVDISNLDQAIKQEIKKAQNNIINDPLRIRTAGAVEEKIRVPETALANEKDYNEFLKSLGTDILPEWQWSIRHEIRKDEFNGDSEELLLLLEFTNTSPISEQSPNTEGFLFDTKLTFRFNNCHILPFELELAPKGFRYNRNLWGRGFNCAIDRIDNISDIPIEFETTNTPIYYQKRYSTKTQPEAPFDKLSRDPIPILKNILQAMCEYLHEWDMERLNYQSRYPDWNQVYEAKFEHDLKFFESEIHRFEQGIELMSNPDVHLAFQLTNETFYRAGEKTIPKKNNWRLFQIVFLVSQLPEIAILAKNSNSEFDKRNVVDIIYFPTGGGKTEAYLAVIVFHCFFDRLRGKSAGVTAWTRFPLRLLTLQQTQRVADIIGIAELVRREQTNPRLNGKNIDGFAVGYFVGKEATPNEITAPKKFSESNDPHWSQAMDDAARQKWKKIMKCPSCRTNSIYIDFNPDTVRLIHRCTNEDCAFSDGIIPVYVVDNEIYRYLPCVILGTIDKLAGLGNQRKMSLIFGQVDGQCEIHGYYKRKCCQKDCSNKKLNKMIPEGISGPTLFVQDELHLLKEGLGTFDSHYETFTQRIRKEFGQLEPLKIIASSATVEAFERQVAHLYGRTQARIFPGIGPTLEKSFYAETFRYPQRLFVGIIPHNKTIFNAILELIQYYHEVIQDIQRTLPSSQNPYGGKILQGSQEWRTILDIYLTSLTYFLAGRELNSIRTDLEAAVNTDLEQNGYHSLTIDELTGNTSTERVAHILEKLETPFPSRDTSLDAVLATSMVSHGVDIDRLNAMIFYGMPRQNAEYIQASSRVGRAHVGIIFNCLHPARERDQSHYSYFVKFHEFLGQLIEPVAINRWSKFSINRTLSGLFMAVLLQLIANRQKAVSPSKYYFLDFVKKEITDGKICANDFIPILEDAYMVNTSGGQCPDSFKSEIHIRVKEFLDQIISAGSQEWVSNALIPPPMSSLREVDEQIEIELDETGSRWATKSQ